MGSPHEYQVDGIGGATPLTSKAAIISKSERPGVDVDYLFAQVIVNEKIVDTKPNCGNMLGAVGPFAIEQGLVPIHGTTLSNSHFSLCNGTIIIDVNTTATKKM